MTRLFPVLLVLAVACGGQKPAPDSTVAPSSMPVRTDAPPEPEKTEDGPPPAVKAPGNLPRMTQDELDAAYAKLNACVAECAADDADCARACRVEHDPGQVEVISMPQAPPE